MNSPEEYLQNLKDLGGPEFFDAPGGIQPDLSTPEAMKDYLADLRIRKEKIRLLKQDISGAMTKVRLHFDSASSQMKAGVSTWLVGKALGNSLAGRAMRGVMRGSVEQNRHKHLDAYANVERMADILLIEFDGIRNKLKQILVSIESESTPPPQMEARLYACISTEVKGPYTGSQLTALFDAGVIDAETLCCLEGTEAWQPLSACTELKQTE